MRIKDIFADLPTFRIRLRFGDAYLEVDKNKNNYQVCQPGSP